MSFHDHALAIRERHAARREAAGQLIGIRQRARATATPSERLHKKTYESACGCWIWTGTRNRAGYGMTSNAGSPMVAHKWAWTVIAGRELPPDLTLHHKCGIRHCVNPDHLEALTREEHGRIHGADA